MATGFALAKRVFLCDNFGSEEVFSDWSNGLDRLLLCPNGMGKFAGRALGSRPKQLSAR